MMKEEEEEEPESPLLYNNKLVVELWSHLQDAIEVNLQREACMDQSSSSAIVLSLQKDCPKFMTLMQADSKPAKHQDRETRE